VLKNTAKLNISTYGDLAFLSQMDPMPDHVTKALEEMVEQGFDREVLKRII
jgi:hypothetical protein